MSNPIDLTDLREITDGDAEIEKELFEDFIQSFEEKMEVLEANYSGGENEVWKNNTHAIKGISMNLGAGPLSELCKTAQDSFCEDETTKQELLSKIKIEYALVKEYLEDLLKNF